MSRVIKIYIGVILIVLFIVLYAFWEAKTLLFTNHIVEIDDLPLGFNGYTIAVISDLHCRDLSRFFKKILHKLKENKVEVVLFLGDMVGDKRNFLQNNPKNFFALCDVLKNYPQYYITGNHEKYADITFVKGKLRQKGVIVLENDVVSLRRNNDIIYLAGLEHPKIGKNNIEEFFIYLSRMQGTKILLSHVPKFWDEAKGIQVDLTLCGHTHGGQIRIPIQGALYIPDQGWFPKYDQGWFQDKKSKMYISRGVGTTAFPIRLLCPPEIGILHLKSKVKSR